MKYRIFLVAAVVGLVLSPHAFAADSKQNVDTYRLLNLFGDVFERVRADYVEEPTDEELIESAINGMLTALDPHSSYLNAKNFREMQVQTRGEFGGLGIEVTMDGGLVKVVSPIDDTPAFRAGIEPGDLVTHLDGEQVLRIKRIFEEHGATAKISSIHVNGWYGEFDKLSAAKSYMREFFDLDPDRDRDRCAFAGDSPNDEPMFRWFVRSSFGVANLRRFENLVDTMPAYICSLESGAGFAELVETILNLRIPR